VRYTSYPTVPARADGFGEAGLRAALARCSSPALALYIHVPYCERLCSFCACNRRIAQDRSVVEPLLAGLARQADLLGEALARTMYA